MIRFLKAPAVLLLAMVAFAGSASAASGDCRLIRGATTPDDPTDDVQVCELATYFHRTGPGLANLNPLPSWNATAPTATDSAGYAGLIGTIGTGTQTRPTFEGTFTGNIDTLRIDSFITMPAYQVLLPIFPLYFTLTIDGNTVIAENPAVGSEHEVPLQPTSEDGVSKMSFAIKNLYQGMDNLGLELGDDVQHTVRIQIAAVYWGDSQNVHWFDSVSRPSGIYFNPSKTQGVVLNALDYT